MMRSIPEDSVLRRHLKSAFDFGQRPPGIPEDSVLRRLFLATLDVANVSSKTTFTSFHNTTAITPPKPAGALPGAITRPRSAEREQKKTIEAATNVNSNGLLGWLKRLFGR